MSKMRSTLMIDGIEVQPTRREWLGLLLIDLGGWLLKGSKPNRIEYHSTKPGAES